MGSAMQLPLAMQMKRRNCMRPSAQGFTQCLWACGVGFEHSNLKMPHYSNLKMMRSNVALGFMCACALIEPSRGVPVMGMDLPRELVMDVNKAPYPIVNIIADMPTRTGDLVKALTSSRRDDRERETAEAVEQENEVHRMQHDLESDNQVLERLSTINGLASRLRR